MRSSVMARPDAPQGNFAMRDVPVFLRRLRLGETGPCELGIGEDDGGNRARRERHVRAGNHFDRHAPLV